MRFDYAMFMAEAENQFPRERSNDLETAIQEIVEEYYDSMDEICCLNIDLLNSIVNTVLNQHNLKLNKYETNYVANTVLQRIEF